MSPAHSKVYQYDDNSSLTMQYIARHSSHSTLHQRNEVRATSSIFDGYDGGSKRPMAASINNGAVRQPKRSVSYGAGSSGSAYGYGGYSPGLQSQGQGQEQGRVRGQNLSRYGTPVADSSEGNDRGGMRGGLVQTSTEQGD